MTSQGRCEKERVLVSAFETEFTAPPHLLYLGLDPRIHFQQDSWELNHLDRLWSHWAVPKIQSRFRWWCHHPKRWIPVAAQPAPPRALLPLYSFSENWLLDNCHTQSSSWICSWLSLMLDLGNLQNSLEFGFPHTARRWIHFVLLVISGFQTNVKKFTKANSLDHPPDLQHFTNSMKL